MGDLEDTALHEAVRYGDVEEVKGALRDGLDPNQIGLYEWSALHEAANNGDVEILKLLLKYEGDANRKDLLRGCTAVHYACSEGHPECLKLLLRAGGRYNIHNAHGKSPLDVATGECLQILTTLREQDLIKENTRNKETHKPSSDRSGQDQRSDQGQKSGQGMEQDRDEIEVIGPGRSGADGSERDSLSQDCDRVSLSSEGSRGTAQSWGSGSVVGINKLTLGHVQLSFEYNSKKSTFKVRVWQLMDLLMPPVETSMISGVYVKSHLLPDKKKETKRKTEVIPVYKGSGSQDNVTRNASTIFHPASYTFNKALEYNKIKKEMITEKTLHLEVCVTQKYSFRSFVIASWNAPLKMAVKKLVKEKYALTPRISTELPENMKVYSADRLSVTYSNRAYNSNPNLRAPSVSSLYTTPCDRSASDSDLKKVKVETIEEKVPSIEITVPSEDEEDRELAAALEQIAVLERSELTPSEAGSVSLADLDDPDDPQVKGYSDDLAGQGLHEVMVHSYGQPEDQVVIDLEKKGSKKKRRFSLIRKKDKEKDRSSISSSSVVEVELASYDLSQKNSGSSSLSPSKETVLSRPETPTWDDHEESLTFGSLYPMDFEFDDAEYGNSSKANLPMETCLEIPSVHRKGPSISDRAPEEPSLPHYQVHSKDESKIKSKTKVSEITKKRPSKNQNERSEKSSAEVIRSSPSTEVLIPEDVSVRYEDDCTLMAVDNPAFELQEMKPRLATRGGDFRSHVTSQVSHTDVIKGKNYQPRSTTRGQSMSPSSASRGQHRKKKAPPPVTDVEENAPGMVYDL